MSSYFALCPPPTQMHTHRQMIHHMLLVALKTLRKIDYHYGNSVTLVSSIWIHVNRINK